MRFNLTFILLEFVIICIQTKVIAVTEGNPENVVKPQTTRGMVIDAGSGGSRLHIYRWAPRVFKTLPPSISTPTADEKWTGRMTPGVADLIGSPDLIYKHLMKLISFATTTLAGEEENFADYPIFFKATGGMRQIPLGPREEIMETVRAILSNKTLCPFYFSHDMARVISGEEEAIYSWTAVNFLLGTLLPANEGDGIATPGNKTYGTVDLGGASSQIAFFVPSQDVSEGLFKLQIGGHKHWNVYTKSFLQFGQNSARLRHVTGLADLAVDNMDIDSAEVPTRLNYCFFAGYSENVFPSNDLYSDLKVVVTGPPVPAQDQFYRCLEEIRPLLVKYNNDYCNVVYNGQCSINGAYQPNVNDMDARQFIGTSSYRYPWEILKLPDTATLYEYKEKAKIICSKTFREAIEYYEINNLNIADEKLGEMIPNYCFLITYTYALLTEGYGFSLHQTLTVLDEVRGNKVSWALGAILYEINTMPWEYIGNTYGVKSWVDHIFLLFLGILIGMIVMYVFTHKEIHHILTSPSNKDHHHPTPGLPSSYPYHHIHGNHLMNNDYSYLDHTTTPTTTSLPNSYQNMMTSSSHNMHDQIHSRDVYYPSSSTSNPMNTIYSDKFNSNNSNASTIITMIPLSSHEDPHHTNSRVYATMGGHGQHHHHSTSPSFFSSWFETCQNPNMTTSSTAAAAAISGSYSNIATSASPNTYLLQQNHNMNTTPINNNNITTTSSHSSGTSPTTCTYNTTTIPSIQDGTGAISDGDTTTNNNNATTNGSGSNKHLYNYLSILAQSPSSKKSFFSSSSAGSKN